MFALFLTVYEIFAPQEKLQNVNLEIGGHGQGVEERDLRHSTRIIRFHIGDFFRIIATWEHTFTQKVTHTHTHSERREW